jgi:hypothetical protein
LSDEDIWDSVIKEKFTRLPLCHHDVCAHVLVQMIAIAPYTMYWRLLSRLLQSLPTAHHWLLKYIFGGRFGINCKLFLKSSSDYVLTLFVFVDIPHLVALFNQLRPLFSCETFVQ